MTPHLRIFLNFYLYSEYKNYIKYIFLERERELVWGAMDVGQF